MLGIAKNKCKEKIRKNSKIIVIEYDEDKIIEEDYNYLNQDPAIIIIKKEEFEKVNEAMSKLKEEDKQIIQLRLLNGMTASKISELIGESVEAIYSRYRRAIKKFKEIYEKMWPIFLEKDIYK